MCLRLPRSLLYSGHGFESAGIIGVDDILLSFPPPEAFMLKATSECLSKMKQSLSNAMNSEGVTTFDGVNQIVVLKTLYGFVLHSINIQGVPKTHEKNGHVLPSV